ncbi:MAG: glycosyltransferase, partial [Alphaproteobacteria bacterium]|nr:glycosyltransferase [Alphaproteobacteria bacterium]
MVKAKKKEVKRTKTIKTITVKNTESDSDTEAQILIQNKIDYTPKVSVIIPVYNVEPYLRECLDSVINQTLKEIEIICVDDGSTDNSLEILKEYAAKDKRITVITQKNLYAGVARNAGLAVAKGEYLSFLDSDDFFELTLFEETYDIAKKEQSQIVFYQYTNYDNDLQQCDGNPRGINKRITNENYTSVNTYSMKDNLFTLCNPMPWNKLVSHKLVVEENLHYQTLKASNDVCFSLNVIACAEKITLYYKSLVYYRHNRRDSLKNTRDNAPLNFYEAYKGIYNTLSSKGLYEKYKKTFLTSLTSSCLWTLKNTDEKHNFVKDFIKNTIIPEFSLLKDNERFLEENRIMFLRNLYLPNIIISLTSYPARIPTLNLVVESLLNQSAYADKVILWLAPEQFPNKEADLPPELLNLREKGLTISWYKDIRSYKKLIPTLRLYPNDIIVTADDDNIYQRDWLKKLIDSYIKHPLDIQAHRVTKFHYANGRFYTVSGGREYYKGANYLNKLVGLGGVLYPPHCFYKDILREDLIKQLAPTNDDQWFWLQAAMNGVRVRVVEDPIVEAHLVEGTQETGLTNINDHGENLFWKDFNRILKYYPVINDILKSEDKLNIASCKKYSPYREELEHWYERLHHKKLNLNNPKTFNEKIQWLKLYASTPIKTRLADKYLVRDWVKETIGEKYLIPLLGVYDSFDEINFDGLQNQFVIKCNHGSGYNIIVKDKSQIDKDEIRSKLTRWMNENFAFRVGTELQYKNMQPKIIIEQMIKNEKAEDLNDYKFYCFNGVVKYVQVISERINGTHKVSFYDMNWKKQPWWDNVFYEGKVEKPKKIDEMVMLAEKMCQGFCFVRVDLYYLDTNEIYFGEMTFSPSSGGMRWSSEAINLRLGEMINLPKLAYDIDEDKYYKPKKISLLKQYFMLPFYLSKINTLKHIKVEKISEYLMSELLGLRIDVKNFGNSSNSIDIISDDLSVNSPRWFADSKGVGKMLQGCSTHIDIRIKVINSGVLKIIFRGQDKRYAGERLHLWIDYKSIKIDDRELLLEPKEVWHDEPYRYEMPVSDGQEIIMRIEQQPHKYTEDELKDLLFKLSYDKEYVKENIECAINSLKDKFITDEETNRKRNFEKRLKNVITTLTSYRLDIKNFGTENNNVEVSANDGSIEMPKWFINTNGKGIVLQGTSMSNCIKLRAINDGELRIDFRAQDKRYTEKRLPLWIDYTSIKIDGNDKLSTTVCANYENPIRYKMPVKDGQEITLEIKQKYHTYPTNEFYEILDLMGINNDKKEIIDSIYNELPIDHRLINTRYTYNKNLPLDSKYFNEKNLCVKEYNDFIVLPAKVIGYGSYPWYKGGIVDENFDYKENSASELMYGGYEIDAEIAYIEDNVYYLGCFHRQWGHFLLQCIGRVWEF